MNSLRIDTFVWLLLKPSCDEDHRAQLIKSFKTVFMPWDYEHLFRFHLLVLRDASTMHLHFFDHLLLKLF